MRIKDYEFPDDLYYEKNHFWAKFEGGLVVTGVTEFTAKMAGEITYIELPEKGDEVTQGKPVGSIESGKWVGRAYAVVSGEVVEVNEDAEDEPDSINEDPYGVWLFKIKPENLEEELSNLMKADDELTQFIEAEIERLEIKE